MNLTCRIFEIYHLPEEKLILKTFTEKFKYFYLFKYFLYNAIKAQQFQKCPVTIFSRLYFAIEIKERSNHQDVFCKKGALRNFAKFAGKHLCQSLYFNKVAGLRLQISQNTFFYRTPLKAASEKTQVQKNTRNSCKGFVSL